MNTVSSVERRVTALPEVFGAIDSGAFKGSLKAARLVVPRDRR
jgi:hypothetical protein